jgi:hypothetical protein
MLPQKPDGTLPEEGRATTAQGKLRCKAWQSWFLGLEANGLDSRNRLGIRILLELLVIYKSACVVANAGSDKTDI